MTKWIIASIINYLLTTSAMWDLLHQFAWLSYEEKKKKVLAVLSLYLAHQKIAWLHKKIMENQEYPEYRFDEIYNTLIRYAQRKYNQKQAVIQQSYKQHISDIKKEQKNEGEQERIDADILLDSLLDQRCD